MPNPVADSLPRLKTLAASLEKAKRNWRAWRSYARPAICGALLRGSRQESCRSRRGFRGTEPNAWAAPGKMSAAKP